MPSCFFLDLLQITLSPLILNCFNTPFLSHIKDTDDFDDHTPFVWFFDININDDQIVVVMGTIHIFRMGGGGQ